MRITAVVLLLASLMSGAEEQFTFLGAVEKAGGKEITIKTQRGSFPVSAGPATEVAKDKVYRDFSALKVGDEISARCQPDASGKLVAVKIWASAVNLTGAVKETQGDEVVIDIQNGERKIVRLYPDTVFGTHRKDLAPGKQVRVNGVEAGSGVDAIRVAVYNTDTPLKDR